MADPQFFTNRGPFTVAQIAAQTGCEIQNGTDTIDAMAQPLIDVAPLDRAEGDHVSFIDNRKYRDAFKSSRAGACFMRPDMVPFAPPGMICLATPTPYKAYALAAQMFYPLEKPDEPSISPRAYIDPSVQMGAGCHIEPGVVIAAGVILGDHVWVEANATISKNVQIGSNSRIGQNASVAYAIIGQGVRIYPGARIGQDGFGFAIDPKGFVKVPQLGRVIIEDFCEIGANTCIDRGAGPDTVIGMGTWLDNLVQIAHNVKIGRGCILVGQVGIAGSTVIEDFVAIGGQAGVAGHLHIGKGAQLAAGSGVITDIDAGLTVMGYPALPKTQFMRHVAYLNRATAPKKNSDIQKDAKE